MEILTTLMGGTILASAGGLAAMVAVIVQVLKNLLPKGFPTKYLTMIVSLFVVFGFIAVTSTFTAPTIIGGIFSSFIISFISMFGFDTFKELVERTEMKGSGDDEGDGTE